jgi:mono/diheme cytochrome c family protein
MRFQIFFTCLTLAFFLLVSPGSRADDEKSRKKISDATRLRIESMSLYFKGQRTFESQCAPCHGGSGKGNGPWAITLENKPRNFRTGVFKFRTTPYGKLPSDDDLRRTIRSGISGTAMPTFQKLTNAELDAVVAYIQNFSRRWRDETQYGIAIVIPTAPKWLLDDAKQKTESDKGAPLFSLMCASCHGVQGKGDGLAGKELMDIWERPIAPADLTQPHHKSGDAPTDLYRTIATGLDGTPMIGLHGTLKTEQIWSLVAFIQSIEKKLEPRKP